jgi:hypothetical protein
LEITSGSVPSAFTVDSQVDHSLEFCPGVADSDGPMIVALGALAALGHWACRGARRPDYGI